MCDMTYSYVWHDLFICVTWLIHMCDMTYSYVWHDLFISVTWLIYLCMTTHSSRVTILMRMCDMTHSCVWHDSFMCMTWLIHVCDLCISSRHIHHVWQYSQYSCTCEIWHAHMFGMTHSHVWHDLFTCVTWLISMCDMTHSHVWHMTHSYVWYDSVIRVTWLIHVCDLTHSNVRPDSCIYATWLMHVCNSITRVTWLNHMCDVTQSHVWRDSIARVTWLNHTCDVTQSHVWRDSITFATWFVHTCDMRTWLIHMCDMIQSYVTGQVAQGALSTSNENVGIPQWAMGCRNRRSPESHKSLLNPQYENSARSNNLWYQVFCFQIIWIQSCLDKNIRFFVKAGLYPNYLISSKQKTWYHKLLLNAEFSYCGIPEGSVEFSGFGDSDIPQPTVGFPHFCLKSIGPPVASHGVAHSHMRHDSITRVTWLNHICNMFHAHVWYDSIKCAFMRICDMTRAYERLDSCTCATWLKSHVCRDSIICNRAASKSWHGSFTCATWLMHMYEMTQSHVRHDSFTCVTLLSSMYQGS